MGKLSLAAKITHVPSMYLSELPGKHHGCTRGGHRRAPGDRPPLPRAGVDTIVVSDVHWLVNAGYHVNCNARFEGIYTSKRAAPLHQGHGLCLCGQPGAGPPDRSRPRASTA